LPQLVPCHGCAAEGSRHAGRRALAPGTGAASLRGWQRPPYAEEESGEPVAESRLGTFSGYRYMKGGRP
jgi:hypothetical protein